MQNLKNKFESLKKDFPILKEKVNGKKLIYVDNGATTQKPKIVIDKLVEFYSKYNSNIHRGVHTMSEMATREYENVRNKVAKFINSKFDEIVFTSGTTQGMNMVAFGLIDEIKKGDEILLTQMEHHANLVPWQEVAKKKGAKLKFIPITNDYTLDLNQAKKLINKKTKIVSLPHISNVLGTINPISKITKLAKLHNAITILDGAQSVPHMKTDVKKLGIDFLVFSGHKMCAPTGVGILYGKKEKLELLSPITFGGDMIYEVEYENSTYNKVPYRLEAGTPNIADVIAFGTAIDYLENIKMKDIEKYEIELTKYFLKRIKEVKNLKIYGPNNYKNRGAVFSFTIKNIHSHDIGAILDKYGIAIRGGHHCAMPLTNLLNISSTSRISLYFYNTIKEIDYIIETLKKVEKEYESGKFLL